MSRTKLSRKCRVIYGRRCGQRRNSTCANQIQCCPVTSTSLNYLSLLSTPLSQHTRRVREWSILWWMHGEVRLYLELRKVIMRSLWPPLAQDRTNVYEKKVPSTSHLHHSLPLRISRQSLELLPSSRCAHSNGTRDRIHQDHAQCDQPVDSP